MSHDKGSRKRNRDKRKAAASFVGISFLVIYIVRGATFYAPHDTLQNAINLTKQEAMDYQF